MLLILSLLFSVPSLSTFAVEQFSSPGATDVTIPSFGPNGMISWSLKAKEVSPANDGSNYLVKKPKLKMVTKGNTIANATSDAGTFDLSKGTASGETWLKVSGNGFMAKGNSWSWRQEKVSGMHQMALESDAYVHFKSEIEPMMPRQKEIVGATQKKMLEVGNTYAEAHLIELVTRDQGGYLFVLEGNVSVKGELVEILCSRMDIVVQNDGNRSEMNFGRITDLNATGNVKMKQKDRFCEADMLVLDTIEGTALLVGNARVEDVEWGIVSGDTVELDKDSGRARVLGTENKKPRLVLPNFGKISLPGLRKTQKK